jgi:transposase
MVVSGHAAYSGFVDEALAARLVPDEFWSLVEPLIPPFAPRPQGGGRAPAPPRAVFTAIVYVLTSGCPWRLLPRSFGVDYRTAHRRFAQWTSAGLWSRVHAAVLDELGPAREVEWSRAILTAASIRAGDRAPCTCSSLIT